MNDLEDLTLRTYLHAIILWLIALLIVRSVGCAWSSGVADGVRWSAASKVEGKP